jgi:SPP1 family predicted phage head-tail adaptor
MRGGTLKDWITIQQAGNVKDELGQPIPGWPDLDSMWGDIRFLSGLEASRADAPVSIVKASIRIRRRTDVLANMRAVDDEGRIYDIKAVLPNKQNRQYIDLVCETGANSG